MRDLYEDVVGWTVSEVAMGDYRDFCFLEPASGAAGVCHTKGESARAFGEGRRYAVIEGPAGAVCAVYEDRRRVESPSPLTRRSSTPGCRPSRRT